MQGLAMLLSPASFNGYLNCQVRFILDSQQPRVVLSVANDMTALTNGGHLIFPAQDNHFEMGIESYEVADEIHRLRREHPQWFEGIGIVSCIRILPRKPAVQVGAPWMLEGDKLDTWTQLRKYATTEIYAWSAWEPRFQTVEKFHGWMRVLQHMVNPNGSGEPRAFWAYHRSEAQNPGDGFSRRPELPWLRSAKDGSYCKWVPMDPFFYDEHERKWRLLEASRAEREGQRLAVVNIFNYRRTHQAWFQRVPGTQDDFYVHVKVISTANEKDLVVPGLAESTDVKFTTLNLTSTRCQVYQR
jgi:hypothetical protein